jgi:hypothetical protein
MLPQAAAATRRCGLFALGGALERAVGGEVFGDANDFRAERAELRYRRGTRAFAGARGGGPPLYFGM